MTQREITEKWLRSIGRHLEGGTRKGDDLAAILPFLILDIFYDYYRKGVALREYRQEKKQLKQRMAAAYNSLNGRFFAAFNDDERDEVIDIMDSLEDYVANDVTIAETSVWNVFKNYPETDYLVSLYMCNMMAKAAQAVWMVVYHNQRDSRIVSKSGKTMVLRSNIPVCNKDIDTLLFTTRRLAELELGTTFVEAKDEGKVKNLLAASDVLGRKMVRFIMKEDGK